jgi:alkylation response protein AidB-like acyl-CoA dehydrogenase
VINFGSDEMKKAVVPAVLSGEKFISLAITEPGAGSDVANLSTRAEDAGEHFVLNGEKKWITQGGKSKKMMANPDLISFLPFLCASLCI